MSFGFRGLSVALFCLLVASSNGCSVSAGNGDGNPTPTDTQLNGMSPDQAYGQFQTKVLGNCTDPTTVEFQIVTFGGPFSTLSLGTDPTTGLMIQGELDYFMKPNGDGDAHYIESNVTSCGDGCTNSVGAYRIDQWIHATWQVSGDSLVVAGVGTATYLSYNDKPSLDLKFADSFISRQAAGQTTLGVITDSTTGDNGISINQYCGQ